MFARDELGNALGGIRLAAVEAPTATHTGINSGTSFCRLYGSYEPFDAHTIRTLYPTHVDYLEKVRETVRANLDAGYILEVDAAETLRQAELSEIGRQ